MHCEEKQRRFVMSKKFLKLGLMLAGILLLSAQVSVAGEKPAPGDGPPPPPHGMAGPERGPGPDMIAPEKKEIFDAIMKKFKDQSQKVHQDMFAKQAELIGALAAGTVDEAKAKTLSKEFNALQAQLNDLDTERKIEMRKQGIPFGPYMLPHHGMGPGGPGQGGPGHGMGPGGPGHGGPGHGGPGMGKGDYPPPPPAPPADAKK
jgi:Spy/CpxP family protein refolding chaperone